MSAARRWCRIPGGEPLMHPQIDEIVDGLVARKKYIYLCTNALLLKEKLDLFKPSKYLTFSVHVDGAARAPRLFGLQRRRVRCRAGRHQGSGAPRLSRYHQHDAVRRRRPQQRARLLRRDDGSRRRRHDAVARLLLRQGARPEALSWKARTRRLFRAMLSNRKTSWVFNQSPLFLEFLMGKRDYACTPWGMPTYNLFGWQKPCYLLQDGYADTFAELMQRDRVAQVRHRIGQSEVRELHGPQRLRGFGRGPYVQLMERVLRHRASDAFSSYNDDEALAMLDQPLKPVTRVEELVQLETK